MALFGTKRKALSNSLLASSLLVILVVASSCMNVLADATTEGTCAADDESCSSPGGTDGAATLCEDQNDLCAFWAEEHGECDKNPNYMHVHCKRSCKKCPDQRAMSEEDLLKGADLGVEQTIAASGAEGQRTLANIVEAREYLATVEIDQSLKNLCKNQHAQCSFWATLGECEKNPKYMKINCAPACKTCDFLSIEGRCPLDPDAPDSWGPGDLDKMFRRLTTEPYLSLYDTKILSSPDSTGGPWVITMENVVNETEAERLIELGAIEGYARSADVGKMKADGTFESNVNSGRTSTNAWCQNDCYANETSKVVVNRLTDITGINETNSEFLQLLRYEEGQKYQVHHDYIGHHLKRQPGVRLLTLYLYLNDVEEGGGTNFDKLDITVMPKRGRALLWPSVLDSDPNMQDGRTTHQALAVGKNSIKYGANAWFHQRDFKGPNLEGCH